VEGRRRNAQPAATPPGVTAGFAAQKVAARGFGSVPSSYQAAGTLRAGGGWGRRGRGGGGFSPPYRGLGQGTFDAGSI